MTVTPDPAMKSVEFRRQREESWRRLEHLLTRAEKAGLSALGERELIELPSLHRAATSALSVARAVSLDRNLLDYLENLAARSHACVYGMRRSFWSVAREFLVQGFPRAVRAVRWHLAVSIAILTAGVATGLALTLDDIDRFYSLIPDAMAQDRVPSATDAELREPLYQDDVDAKGVLTYFATYLFAHNTSVGILCFALGFAAGIPVVYLLFYNGLMLGALAALYHTRNMSLDFWGWVLPHGVTELLAIALCGAAGLLQGQAIVFPGRRSRIGALAAAGKRAGFIIAGCAILFFVAALIEGLFRQLVHHVGVRYSVVAATAAVWISYFTLVGRGSRT